MHCDNTESFCTLSVILLITHTSNVAFTKLLFLDMQPVVTTHYKRFCFNWWSFNEDISESFNVSSMNSNKQREIYFFTRYLFIIIHLFIWVYQRNYYSRWHPQVEAETFKRSSNRNNHNSISSSNELWRLWRYADGQLA